jgi:hypothetical protein
MSDTTSSSVREATRMLARAKLCTRSKASTGADDGGETIAIHVSAKTTR